MKKFRYEREAHSYGPPEEYDYKLRERVNEGWRLISVVKEDKEKYWSYWEKEE